MISSKIVPKLLLVLVAALLAVQLYLSMLTFSNLLGTSTSSITTATTTAGLLLHHNYHQHTPQHHKKEPPSHRSHDDELGQEERHEVLLAEQADDDDDDIIDDRRVEADYVAEISTSSVAAGRREESHKQTHNKRRRNKKNKKQRNSKSIPQYTFPRWGSEGIDINAVVSYLHATTMIQQNPTPNPTTQKRKQQRKRVLVDSSSPFSEIPHVFDSKGVWFSLVVRNHTPKKQIRHRIFPSQRLLHHAWEIFMKTKSQTQPSKRWPHLHHAVMEHEAGVPFVVWHGDFRGCNYHNSNTATAENGTAVASLSVPIFTTCAHVNCSHAFPFPTYETIDASMEHTQQWNLKLRKLQQTIPWKSKHNQIIWRGSLSGPLLNYKSPRCRLALFIQQHHNHSLLNIGIHNIPARHYHRPTQSWRVNFTAILGTEVLHTSNASAPTGTVVGAGNDEEDDKSSSPDTNDSTLPSWRTNTLAPFVKSSDFVQYKAILDTDGNSWSSRFGSLLCTNSIVLKVQPHYVDYFYKYVQPWKHYIPVKYDLSDLITQVEYALHPDHTQQIQTIIHNANTFCRRHMVYDAIAHDMLDILDDYVQYLDLHTKNWSDVWSFHKRRLFALPKLVGMQNITGHKCRYAIQDECYVP